MSCTLIKEGYGWSKGTNSQGNMKTRETRRTAKKIAEKGSLIKLEIKKND